MDAGQIIKDIKEISIAIDSLDDIFSDFDPSPLHQRIFSEDFVAEIKKRYKQTKSGQFSVTIIAPISLKNDTSEKTIKQRIKQHFKLKALQNKQTINHIRKRGFIFIAFGALFLIAITILTYYKILKVIWLEMIGIIIVPLGWFGIWEGVSKIVDIPEMMIHNTKIFDNLSKANYNFKYLE